MLGEELCWLAYIKRSGHLAGSQALGIFLSSDGFYRIGFFASGFPGINTSVEEAQGVVVAYAR